MAEQTPGPLFRYCPCCGLMKAEASVRRARADRTCPRCGKRRLSQFYPTKPATKR